MIIANFSEATSAPTESSYTVTDVNNEIIFFKKWTLLHTSQCHVKFNVEWDMKKNSRLSRLRVVPHFSSGIVERAKRDRAWKSPHARKGDTRRGEREMRDYRQSPSFWSFTAEWFWSVKFVSPSKSIKSIPWDSFPHWAVFMEILMWVFALECVVPPLVITFEKAYICNSLATVLLFPLCDQARPWFWFSTWTSSVAGVAFFLVAATRATLVICAALVICSANYDYVKCW